MSKGTFDLRVASEGDWAYRVDVVDDKIVKSEGVRKADLKTEETLIFADMVAKGDQIRHEAKPQAFMGTFYINLRNVSKK